MKLILIFQLLAGLFLAFIAPAFQRASTTALWSDFKAFEARVRADEAGERVLNYGGENPKESFQQLLKQLWQLPKPMLPRIIGVLISISSGIGLLLLSRSNRAEHALQPNA